MLQQGGHLRPPNRVVGRADITEGEDTVDPREQDRLRQRYVTITADTPDSRPIVGYGDLVGVMQTLLEVGAVAKGVKLSDGTLDMRPDVIRTDEHVVAAALRGVLIVEREGRLELAEVRHGRHARA